MQNKPEMRLLLKNPGGTFLQIQTDIYQKQKMEIKKNAIKIDGPLPFADGRISDEIDSFFI